MPSADRSGTLPRVRGVLTLAAALLLALALVGVADASYIVDRNAAGATLRISGNTAIVDYRVRGVAKHALLSGAVNARVPQAGVPQIKFKVVRGLGLASGGTCRRYTGPPLPFLVVACDAPDGSHWALQSWNRLQPNFGGTSAAWELQASHWRGDLPKLDVWVDWASGGRYEQLFGRYTYLGEPVHGFHTTSGGAPLDTYGRNVYLDVLDSGYGSGWHRENSFVAHNPTGAFCYTLYPHGRTPTSGREYRLTAQGPGVSPIVSWIGPSPGAYDADVQAQLRSVEQSLGDRLCRG
jgi:hypothetical protein